jgi:hypothetical protein
LLPATGDNVSAVDVSTQTAVTRPTANGPVGAGSLRSALRSSQSDTTRTMVASTPETVRMAMALPMRRERVGSVIGPDEKERTTRNGHSVPLGRLEGQAQIAVFSTLTNFALTVNLTLSSSGNPSRRRVPTNANIARTPGPSATAAWRESDRLAWVRSFTMSSGAERARLSTPNHEFVSGF